MKKYEFVKKRVDWGYVAEVLDCKTMKDYSIALATAGADNGYSYDFLLEVFEESLEDGQTYPEALRNTVIVAYERDY